MKRIFFVIKNIDILCVFDHPSFSDKFCFRRYFRSSGMCTTSRVRSHFCWSDKETCVLYKQYKTCFADGISLAEGPRNFPTTWVNVPTAYELYCSLHSDWRDLLSTLKPERKRERKRYLSRRDLLPQSFF